MLKYAKGADDKIITEVLGTFAQLPLKLAWAITIHKSQGKTFDNVIIDLGYGAFEYGQTYVALSRCRRLDGIYLKLPIKPKDIKTDDRVSEYYDMMKRYF
jgi:ATP-dependent exoDNAse (exonuclease V) alpha subunit